MTIRADGATGEARPLTAAFPRVSGPRTVLGARGSETRGLTEFGLTPTLPGVPEPDLVAGAERWMLGRLRCGLAVGGFEMAGRDALEFVLLLGRTGSELLGLTVFGLVALFPGVAEFVPAAGAERWLLGRLRCGLAEGGFEVAGRDAPEFVLLLGRPGSEFLGLTVIGLVPLFPDVSEFVPAAGAERWLLGRLRCGLAEGGFETAGRDAPEFVLLPGRLDSGRFAPAERGDFSLPVVGPDTLSFESRSPGLGRLPEFPGASVREPPGR